MNYKNVIVLDFTNCKHLSELHETIRVAFDFPDWYGANWSAFWDLLREPRENTIVEVYGLNTLPSELKESREKIIALLERNKKKWDEYMERDGKFEHRFDFKINN